MAKGRRPAGKHRRQGGGPGWIIAKSVLVSAILTMLLMLLLALLLKNGIIGEDAVPAANQVLKVLGIAVASYLAVRNGASHPWFRGMIAGLLYMVTGIVVFSLFVGSPFFPVDASGCRHGHCRRRVGRGDVWQKIAGPVIAHLGGIMYNNKD